MYDRHHAISPFVKIRKSTVAANRVAAPTPGTVEIHRSLKESEDIKLMCRITKKRELISTLTLNALYSFTSLVG